MRLWKHKSFSISDCQTFYEDTSSSVTESALTREGRSALKRIRRIKRSGITGNVIVEQLIRNWRPFKTSMQEIGWYQDVWRTDTAGLTCTPRALGWCSWWRGWTRTSPTFPAAPFYSTIFFSLFFFFLFFGGVVDKQGNKINKIINSPK